GAHRAPRAAARHDAAPAAHLSRAALVSAAMRTEVTAAADEAERVLALLAAVPDPEIPVLSVVDLGVIRHVRRGSDGRLRVGLTPTYSGCPATEMIRAAVRSALDRHGYP